MTQEKRDLMERLARLTGLLQQYQMMRMRRYGSCGNPHRGQGRVLSILRLQPEISQKELGYLLDMRNQSLGEILAKLEKGGLITRTPSQEDRRTTVIRLTPEGTKAASQVETAKREGGGLFASLSEEERKSFRDSLDRVIAELEERMAEAGPPPRGMEGFPPFPGHHPPMPPREGMWCGFGQKEMPPFWHHHGPMAHGKGHHMRHCETPDCCSRREPEEPEAPAPQADEP